MELKLKFDFSNFILISVERCLYDYYYSFPNKRTMNVHILFCTQLS